MVKIFSVQSHVEVVGVDVWLRVVPDFVTKEKNQNSLNVVISMSVLKCPTSGRCHLGLMYVSFNFEVNCLIIVIANFERNYLSRKGWKS